MASGPLLITVSQKTAIPTRLRDCSSTTGDDYDPALVPDQWSTHVSCLYR